ncbi:NADH-ubiquinone oxidoreductase-F iron-sulfur binding region domain-containing protein [Paenarthrobacter sp. CC6]|uniref:NADH-ubiquinone oxidoreductase-F iron-sulfur binding region domain-containing protein n=1 Tax=Paenarthrobacter sp. CC6 TaxID=3029184 RepID=UPI00339C56DE
MAMNLRTLEAAGLTGRSGSAFGTARKVDAARQNGAELIVNACDGEIGALKDAYVIRHHLAWVRHGAALTGLRNVTYAAHTGTETEERLRAAGVPVLPVPARYVASEASALVSLHHGSLARPMTKRRRLIEGGRTPDGKRTRPVLVLNAETVLRIAQIEVFGPAWFRSFGIPAEPGPRLVTISGAIQAPGVYETETGPPLSRIVSLAGGPLPGVLALNIGGLSGTWINASRIGSLHYSAASLATVGTAPGPGVIHLIDSSGCPVAAVKDMLDYAARESAGQCGPCMFGLAAAAGDFAELASGAGRPGAATALRQRLGLLTGRGACHFPDRIAAFTRSALEVFTDHLSAHAAGYCPVYESRGRK